jgi:hypothetical protein
LYPGTLCITQTNIHPGQSLKYSALIGIDVLPNTNMFRAAKIAVTPCDGSPIPNPLGLHSGAELEKMFRSAVDLWLKDDIVATLKSNSNKDGLPPNYAPRNPATNRGLSYSVEAKPEFRWIGFAAQ